MIAFLRRNWASKTFRVGAGAVLAALGAWLMEQISLETMLSTVLTAVMALLARDKKVTPSTRG